MKKLRASRAAAWMGLILCMLALAGCSTAPQTVQVVAALPLSTNPGLEAALNMALEEAGQQAGSVRVELVTVDTGDAASVEAEQRAAARAIAGAQTVAYIGSATNDQAMAVLPALNEAGMVHVTYAATWPGLTMPGYNLDEPGKYYPTGRRNFFRTIPPDSVMAAAAARWAHELGFETVFLVGDSAMHQEKMVEIFALVADDLGMQVVGQESFAGAEAETPEIGALVSRVLNAAPDLVFFHGADAVGANLFLERLRLVQKSQAIMVCEGLQNASLLAELTPRTAEDIYAVNLAPINQLAFEPAQSFWDAYQARTEETPPPQAATVYEAMQVVLHAIEQAEMPTRAGVLDAMAEMEAFSGVFGEWTFNAHGDISFEQIGGWQVKEGAWEFIQVIE